MIDNTTIRKFISKEIIKEGNLDDLKDSDSLIESSIIDSLGIQILIAYLEKTYSIRIADDELIPDNFESIDAIASFVKEKIDRK